jgi:hypothetical protein
VRNEVSYSAGTQSPPQSAFTHFKQSHTPRWLRIRGTVYTLDELFLYTEHTQSKTLPIMIQYCSSVYAEWPYDEMLYWAFEEWNSATNKVYAEWNSAYPRYLKQADISFIVYILSIKKNFTALLHLRSLPNAIAINLMQISRKTLEQILEQQIVILLPRKAWLAHRNRAINSHFYVPLRINKNTCLPESLVLPRLHHVQLSHTFRPEKHIQCCIRSRCVHWSYASRTYTCTEHTHQELMRALSRRIRYLCVHGAKVPSNMLCIFASENKAFTEPTHQELN